MLSLAVRNTKKLVRLRCKEENVRIGRNFTKKATALLMSSLLTFEGKHAVSILDPGAGTGILSAAAVEAACRAGVKEITLRCYETDGEMATMLKDNLKRIRRKCHHDYAAKLIFEVIEENFVTAMRPAFAKEEEATLFDIVIMNPPSELCDRKSPEAQALGNLCADETDLGFLFAVLAMFSLKKGGRMVTLLPTAYASAHYIDRIRAAITAEARVERMHLFLRRSLAEGKTDAIRKTMLLSFVKEAADEGATVTVSTSQDEGATVDCLPPQEYGKVVRPDGTLVLIKSSYDLDLLRCLDHMPETLSSLGLAIHTGLTLDSRYPELLRDAPEAGALPLIHPACIETGMIKFPMKDKNQFIIPRIPSLAQKNKNMLLLKRVPSKSDRRRFVCGIYLAAQLPRYRAISTNNKLNYIDFSDGREMDPEFLYGLYAVLSSDLYNDFSSVSSSQGSINATTLANMPMPDEKVIRKVGRDMLVTRQLSPRVCTQLLYKALHLAV
jgi:adenine-specific DNA-methyltransferase